MKNKGKRRKRRLMKLKAKLGFIPANRSGNGAGAHQEISPMARRGLTEARAARRNRQDSWNRKAKHKGHQDD